MSTKEARTRATAAWRARKQEKLIQAYLHTDIVSRLDALVQERGATGRAAVLADLIESACTPKPDKPEPKPEKSWKLKKNPDNPLWPVELYVDGMLAGKISPPEKRGGQWWGAVGRPGAETNVHRRTRAELIEAMTSMHRVSR